MVSSASPTTPEALLPAAPEAPPPLTPGTSASPDSRPANLDTATAPASLTPSRATNSSPNAALSPWAPWMLWVGVMVAWIAYDAARLPPTLGFEPSVWPPQPPGVPTLTGALIHAALGLGALLARPLALVLTVWTLLRLMAPTFFAPPLAASDEHGSGRPAPGEIRWRTSDSVWRLLGDLIVRFAIADACMRGLALAEPRVFVSPLATTAWNLTVLGAVPLMAALSAVLTRMLDGPSRGSTETAILSFAAARIDPARVATLPPVPVPAQAMLTTSLAALVAAFVGAWPYVPVPHSVVAEAARIEEARKAAIRTALEESAPRHASDAGTTTNAATLEERVTAIAEDRRLRAAVREWLPLERARNEAQAVVAAYSQQGRIPPRAAMDAFAVANRRLGLFRERYEGVLPDLRAARRGHEAAQRAYADLRFRLDQARHGATVWGHIDAGLRPIRNLLGVEASGGDGRTGPLLLAPVLGPGFTLGIVAARPTGRDADYSPRHAFSPSVAVFWGSLMLSFPREPWRRLRQRGFGLSAWGRLVLRIGWSFALATFLAAVLASLFVVKAS